MLARDVWIRKVNALTGKISTMTNVYGIQGYSGDSIPDSLAEFYFQPPTYVVIGFYYYYYYYNYGLALDKAGNIYVADGNNRIRKIDAVTKMITTVVGDGTPGGTEMVVLLREPGIKHDPTNVAFDDSGNMYITDLAI